MLIYEREWRVYQNRMTEEPAWEHAEYRARGHRNGVTFESQSYLTAAAST